MSKMSELDAVIKELRQAADSINEAAKTLTEMFSSSKPEEKTVEPTKAEPTLTLSDVRAKLAEKSRNGYTAKVKELLRTHGADKLSEIDPSEYATLMQEAEELGNG